MRTQLSSMIAISVLSAVAAGCGGAPSVTPAAAPAPAATSTATNAGATSSQSSGALALTASGYTTSGATVTVTVSRTGDASGVATVKYATADGTAVAGTDYTSVAGTLTWQAGDSASQTVSVPITGSTGGKTFTLTLSGASGAKLGSPSRATITLAGKAANAATIRVQGNRFVDGNGATVQLRGVNVSGLEYTAVQGWAPTDPWGGMSPNFSAIKSWGANALRFPLNEASWLGYPCVDATGATRNPDPGHNYQATVKTAVANATAAGFYVILDLHWSAPSNFCPLAQNSMADADNSVTFWTSIATTFGANPNVIFELFNEPFLHFLASGETTWGVLMKGGTITEYETGNATTPTVNYTWKAAGMQQLLDAVRATGATNVVLIGGVSWSQDLSQWVANKPTDPAGQIAAVWHAYPNSMTVGDPQAALPKYGSIAYTWTQSVLSAGFPVAITEFGDHSAPGTVGAPLASNVLPWADAHGASYLGWTWDPWGGNDYVLIKDSTGTPTDGFGVYTKAHYLCVSGGGTNCP